MDTAKQYDVNDIIDVLDNIRTMVMRFSYGSEQMRVSLNHFNMLDTHEKEQQLLELSGEASACSDIADEITDYMDFLKERGEVDLDYFRNDFDGGESDMPTELDDDED